MVDPPGEGRRGIGIELKPAYYHQAVKNVQKAAEAQQSMQERTLFGEAVS